MEEIIVLDYYDGSVWIYKLPWLNMTDVFIRDWLDSMGFNLDEVTYMVNPNITINDERK
jgi:hypothetical protein